MYTRLVEEYLANRPELIDKELSHYSIYYNVDGSSALLYKGELLIENVNGYEIDNAIFRTSGIRIYTVFYTWYYKYQDDMHRVMGIKCRN